MPLDLHVDDRVIVTFLNAPSKKDTQKNGTISRIWHSTGKVEVLLDNGTTVGCHNSFVRRDA